jgi:hypothetical protein
MLALVRRKRREVLAREGADWRAAFYREVRRAGADPLVQSSATATVVKEIATGHHRQVLVFLADLARRGGLQEPEIVTRQVLLLIDGATAALMVTNDPAVLDITGRNLRAVLAAAERVAA